ncbi:MAG: 50S ribosomal protein L22 [Myxococcota bacterium]
MESRAVARYVRITPRKARSVANALRGKPVEQAMNILTFTPRRAARILRKLLVSAVSNAEDKAKGKLDVDNLIVSRVFVNQAPTLKRWRARAFGRATRVEKKSCHITVELAEKE